MRWKGGGEQAAVKGENRIDVVFSFLRGGTGVDEWTSLRVWGSRALSLIAGNTCNS
jgi:hypothetical protein